MYSRRPGDPGVGADLLPLVIGPGSARSVRGIGTALRLREPGRREALGEAAWLARRVRADRVHAHFAFGNATAALLYGRLTGVPASFTAHAHDLYANVPPALMRRKIAAAVVRRRGQRARRGAPAGLRRAGRPREGRRAAQRHRPRRRRRGQAGVAAAHPRDRTARPEEGARRADPGGRGRSTGRSSSSWSARAASRQSGGAGARSGARVEFSGPLSHAAALQRLVGASVFALPCRELPSGDRDGLPVAIVEAMSAGVPW